MTQIDFNDHCAWCGKVLPESSWWCRKYCSKRCYWDSENKLAREARAAARANRRCKHCSQPMPAHRLKWCSTRCGNLAYWKRQRPDARCEHCGVSFIGTIRGQRFCSRPCYLASGAAAVAARKRGRVIPVDNQGQRGSESEAA
jgi:predicted nucleic acid-binding Zn ribbon protein